MKNNKGCGRDGIPTEALKHLGGWGVFHLTKMFNDITHSSRMESIITHIHKDKGGHINCSNYRGI